MSSDTESTMGFRKQTKGFSTRAIHAGQEAEQWNDLGVVPPIVTSATFMQLSPGEPGEFNYGRGGNPTRSVLERCLASLNEAEHAVCFSSGMGAATAITQMLSMGDHILASRDIYGGINALFLSIVKKQGVEMDFVDFTEPSTFEASLKSNTKIVWLESPTNPTLKVVDIALIAKIAHSYRNDIIVLVDNTFLTPYYQRPLELGADLVLYSLSKYLNGHSDVIMGAVAMNDEELHRKLRFIQNASGIIPSPFDCYQVNRSIKTLPIRMEQHNKSALIVSKFLESHPVVVKVMHPGLLSHPQHKLALQQSYGHSGILAFYIKGGLEQSKKFLTILKMIDLVVSLGGYSSSVILPARMSHEALTTEQQLELGITDNLIRLSVGLEDVDDIVADLDQALNLSQKQ